MLKCPPTFGQTSDQSFQKSKSGFFFAPTVAVIFIKTIKYSVPLSEAIVFFFHHIFYGVVAKVIKKAVVATTVATLVHGTHYTLVNLNIKGFGKFLNSQYF